MSLSLFDVGRRATYYASHRLAVEAWVLWSHEGSAEIPSERRKASKCENKATCPDDDRLNPPPESERSRFAG
jgi:hypothetical protein